MVKKTDVKKPAMRREDAYQVALLLVQDWHETSRGVTVVQSHLNLQTLIANKLLEAEQVAYDKGWEDADVYHISGEYNRDKQTDGDGGNHGDMGTSAEPIAGNEPAERTD